MDELYSSIDHSLLLSSPPGFEDTANAISQPLKIWQTGSATHFQVIALPVSTCVQEILERSPAQRPRLVTKFSTPPRPFSSPAYQFWTVEYLTSASLPAEISTQAAWSCKTPQEVNAGFDTGKAGCLTSAKFDKGSSRRAPANYRPSVTF